MNLIIENINTPEKLGLALKRLRKNQNMTQAQLAKVLNIRQPTVSDLENGRGTLESFFKIVQALKINLVLASKNARQKEMKSQGDQMLGLIFGKGEK